MRKNCNLAFCDDIRVAMETKLKKQKQTRLYARFKGCTGASYVNVCLFTILLIKLCHLFSILLIHGHFGYHGYLIEIQFYFFFYFFHLRHETLLYMPNAESLYSSNAVRR